MKFAHIADCHIGSWREPKMSVLAINAFDRAIEICIQENVDFVLLAGDLFHTALPSIDKLKHAVIKLRELRKNNIPVYSIAGSHDFSPSGKTMLDVLEAAGLILDVCRADIIEDESKNKEDKLKLKFTVDPKTGSKITGILGKKGMLDKSYYEAMLRDHLESEDGFKIFMFHTAITEFKPKDLANMDSNPLSFLPNNFAYYAGGHVHSRLNEPHPSGGRITMPGPLFPANFKELEELGGGGLLIYDDALPDKLKNVDIVPKKVYPIKIDAKDKTPQQVHELFDNAIKDKSFDDGIVTLRIAGTLVANSVSEVDFKKMAEQINVQGAYFVLRNTNALVTRDFKETKIDIDSIDDIEKEIVQEHIGQKRLEGLKQEDETRFILELLDAFNTEKSEGEKVADYEARVKETAQKVVDGFVQPL